MLNLNVLNSSITNSLTFKTPTINLRQDDEENDRTTGTPRPGEPPGSDHSSPAFLTVPSNSPYYVKAIDSGKVWTNDGKGVTINYKFWDALPSHYSSSSTESHNFQAFTSAQKTATLKILDMLASVANVTFNEVSSDSSAQMGFAQANLGSGVGAWAYYPGTSAKSGDVWTNNYYSQTKTVTDGSYGFMVLAHEIGHAMGLAHPFDSSPTLASGEDSSRYTIMSYTWPFYAESYMIYDIAALQAKYGVNNNFATGNDNYVLKSGHAYAIWDAGGTDTLDGSAISSSMTLNLNAGEMSSVGKIKNIGIAYGATIENAKGGNGSDTIYTNAAANHIWGNGGNDRIYASAGNDIIDGGTGTDTVIYSYNISDFLIKLVDSITVTLTSALLGFDTLISIEKFIFGSTTYDFSDLSTYADPGTTDPGTTDPGTTDPGTTDPGTTDPGTTDPGTTSTINGTSGSDTLHGGASDDIINGNGGYDKLYGGGGDDIIHGGSYIDKLYGEAGNDTLYGYDGYDTLDGGTGNDTLYGGDGNDYLYGGDGNDVLDGGAGNDRIYGQASDDIIMGSTGNDYIYGGSGTDEVVYEQKIEEFVISIIGTTYVKVVHDVLGTDILRYMEKFTFNDQTFNLSELQDYLDGVDDSIDDTDTTTDTDDTGGTTLTGTSASEILRGGDGDDVINGNGGYDRLYGGGGNDVLNGDDGNDYLYGESGNDTLLGGEGSDRLYGDAGNDILNGGNGNDYLYGKDGDDTLIGGDGNDYLYGDNGDDILIAGLGRDTLYGRSGSDTFAFDKLDSNTDYFRDFTLNGSDADKINITDVLDGFNSGDNINDFVQLNLIGSTRMELMINQDGVGNDWVKAASITGSNFSGVTINDLTASGQLITGESLL